MTEVTFKISQEELRKLWSEQCTPKQWIDMYENVFDSYDTWHPTLEIAEYLINKLRKEYFEKVHYLDIIPDSLKPLVTESLKNDFLKKNEENANITIDEVSGEDELEAIERLREYKSLSYDDGLNLFCEGYEFAKESLEFEHKPLDEYSIDELFAEIKRRSL